MQREPEYQLIKWYDLTYIFSKSIQFLIEIVTAVKIRIVPLALQDVMYFALPLFCVPCT